MFNSNSESNSHYLVLTEKERSYGIHILSCGYQKCKPHSSYPPYEHPGNYLFNSNDQRILKEFQLIYIVEGKGKLVIENQEHDITKGTIIFVMAGQRHYYHPDPETGWEEYFIGFDGNTVKKMIRANFSSSKNIFRTGINVELIQLFHESLNVIRNDVPMLQFRLSGIVMHMLGLLIYDRTNRLNFIGNHQQVADRAKKMMNDQISGQLKPEDIAQQLELSYSGFRTIFKTQTGHSPARYYRLLKIQKAKQYLNETDIPIGAIAKLLNFNSTNSFMISFKKNTGLSPLEYRNIPTHLK